MQPGESINKPSYMDDIRNTGIETPEGFENWSGEEKRKWAEEKLEELTKPQEGLPKEDSNTTLAENIGRETDAHALLTRYSVLKMYFGDEKIVETEGFSKMPIEQKVDVLKSVSAAIFNIGAPAHGERTRHPLNYAGASSETAKENAPDTERITLASSKIVEENKPDPEGIAFNEWVKEKVRILYLTSESGINFENGELKIGPGASKQDIVEFLKNLKVAENKTKSEPSQSPEPIPALASTPETVAETMSVTVPEPATVAPLEPEPVETPVPAVESTEQEEKKFKIEEIDKLPTLENSANENPVPEPTTEVNSSISTPEQTTRPTDNFEIGSKIIWEGKEETIKNNDGEWVSFESGLIVRLDEIKESLKPKTESNFDKEIELVSKIRDAKNFDELYEILREVGGIQGSDKFYDSDELIGYIDHYRKFPGDIILSAITRSGNLREKVKELFSSEKSPVVPSILEIKPEPSVVPSEQKLTAEASQEQNAIPEEEKIPSLEESEEWIKLKELRNDLAKTEARKNNFSVDTGVAVEELRERYIKGKEKVAELIRKDEYDWLDQGEGPLTKEQESRLNDRLFEKLIKKENDVYLEALRENREKTWKDTVKIEAAKLVGSKAVQWYLKQNKWVRLGMTTAIATGVGYGVGAFAAAGAVGYAGARILRGAASLGAAGGLNKLLQHEKSILSIDRINEQEKKETEDLKNSNLSLEEKSRELADIKEYYDKNRRKAALIKGAMTIAAGASAGLFAGISEHIFNGTGGSSLLDHTNRPRTNSDHLQGPRPGVSETQPPQTNATEQLSEPSTVPESGPNVTESAETSPKPEIPKPEPEILTPEEHPEIKISQDVKDLPNAPSLAEAQIVEPEMPAEVSKEFFADPKILIHEVEAGDSTWKILKDTLENNEQFKAMTEAQKTYVLSALVNKTLENPAEYGLGNNGSIYVGDKTDFTKLFENSKEIKSIFDKAKQTITENSQQAKTIIENNQKITGWVSEHPGIKPTSDKVNEILNFKPGTKIVEPIKAPIPENLESSLKVEPVKAPVPEVLESPLNVEPVKASVQDTLDKEVSEMTKENFIEEIHGPKA